MNSFDTCKDFLHLSTSSRSIMSQHHPSTNPASDPEVSDDERDEDDLCFRDMVEETAMQEDLDEMYDEHDGL